MARKNLQERLVKVSQMDNTGTTESLILARKEIGVNLEDNPIAGAVEAARSGWPDMTALYLRLTGNLLSPQHQGRLLAQAERNRKLSVIKTRQIKFD